MGVCSVYLIASDAPAPNGPWLRDADPHARVYKIGISQSPKARLADLQTASAGHLTLIRFWGLPSRDYARHVESEAHRELSIYRASGEWFFGSLSGAEDWILAAICEAASRRWGWSNSHTIAALVAAGYEAGYAQSIVEFFCGERSVA